MLTDYPKPPEGWHFVVGDLVMHGRILKNRIAISLEPKSSLHRMFVRDRYRTYLNVPSDATEYEIRENILIVMRGAIGQWERDHGITTNDTTFYGTYS